MTLILTLVPSILILMYVIYSDKFSEPLDMILSTFCLGFMLCLPAGILNGALIFSNDTADDYVFIAGFTEETLKFLALFFFVRKRVEFDEPMDAVVYGTLISLGFATYENYEYVYIYNEPFSSLEIASIRAFSAIPLHAFCGIVMGYCFGLYSVKKKKIYLCQSVFIPISLHSFYNYLDNLLLIALLLLLSLITCLYLHQNFVSQQKLKNHEKEF